MTHVSDLSKSLVYLGWSGLPQSDSVPVRLLIILAFSTDSVSLRVGFGRTSSFNSDDPLEAIDPEFTLESLLEV